MKNISKFLYAMSAFSIFMKNKDNVKALIVVLWIGAAVCGSSATVLTVYNMIQGGA